MQSSRGYHALNGAEEDIGPEAAIEEISDCGKQQARKQQLRTAASEEISNCGKQQVRASTSEGTDKESSKRGHQQARKAANEEIRLGITFELLDNMITNKAPAIIDLDNLNVKDTCPLHWLWKHCS
jgi:hypothetical protein